MSAVGFCAQAACVLEATARKPGNVHRFCDFDDVTYLDFLLSAAAVGPVLEQAPHRRVGPTILEGVRATRRVVRSNTNLGMLLLLAPLAAVPEGEDLRTGVARVLGSLDVADARNVYEAIRLAMPGGLGEAAEQDVRQEPTQTLRTVMALAADRDLVARQYASGFHEVWEDGVPALSHALQQSSTLETAIVSCHLHLLATYPDSLIARKRGQAEAEEASRRSGQVLSAGWPRTPSGKTALSDLDHWLRSEGHTRNPGTTADLVTACLFILLREGKIELPTVWGL
jgi:triphosphoribosyl-dephospho-CoA synthase